MDGIYFGNLLDVVSRHWDSEDVDFNAETLSGLTPIHIACQNGHLKVFEQLLKSGTVDVNELNMEGMSLLHIACEREDESLVDALVRARGIDIHCTDKLGMTPLAIVWTNKNYALTRIIIMKMIELAGLDLNGICKNPSLRFGLFGIDDRIVENFCILQSHLQVIGTEFTNEEVLCPLCLDHDQRDLFCFRNHCDNHQFHENCIGSSILKLGARCPICRLGLGFSVNQVQQSYLS
jgi:hypothetical protein